MAKFTLISGAEIEHNVPCLAAQVWNMGKWNNIAVFDETSDGYEQAKSALSWIDIEDGNKQIKIFH